jgi:hypothetical protein
MLLDEIESESEYNSLEANTQPVFRSSLSPSYYKRQDRTWLPFSITSAGKQCYRLSIQDPRFTNKVSSNIRTSIQGHSIFKPFKSRPSTDDIIDEVV